MDCDFGWNAGVFQKIIMKKFLKFLRLVLQSLNGDFAYENYLKTHSANCEKLMSKKEFLLNKQEEKWKKVNRCC